MQIYSWMIPKEKAFQSKAASTFRNVLEQKTGAEAGLQHSLAEKTGKPCLLLGLGINPGSWYEPAPWCWMSGTFSSLNTVKRVFGKFVNPQTFTVFLYWNGGWGLERGTRQPSTSWQLMRSTKTSLERGKNQRNVNSAHSYFSGSKYHLWEKKGGKRRKKKRGKMKKKEEVKRKNISK